MRTLWLAVFGMVFSCNNGALQQAELERDGARLEVAALKERLSKLEATAQPAPPPAPVSVPVAPPPAPAPVALPEVSSQESWQTLAALKPKKVLEVGVKLSIQQIKVAREWPFDRNGYEYSYQTADKNSEYLYIDFQATSSEEDPKLPVLVAYQLTNQKIVYLGAFTTEFYRWESFGSYLGNEHDNGNDFAKKDTVRFTAGVSIPSDVLQNGAVFVGALKAPCQERSYRKFGRPEIEYSSLACVRLIPRTPTAQELLEQFEPVVVRNPTKILAQ